ncbi:MAG: signal peptidase [Acidobacteria bacterium]|jgi:signal peptidase I|nr:signal peptidase [Acidobacteriota bacterium]
MTKSKVFSELRVLALMILIVTSLRSALADWNDVPSGSMKPTIQVGDRVVVNKLAYDLKIPFTTIEIAKWGDPKRGDIVVLFSPQDGTRLVKRVVATPGDTIAMQDNELFVNGRAAQWKQIASSDDAEQGRSIIAVEALPGHSHKVMFSPERGALRWFEPRVVPPGQYFVMGDNRDNSNDSRYIGVIPREKIVGRATAVAFSVDRKHWYTPRLDRFFTALD